MRVIKKSGMQWRELGFTLNQNCCNNSHSHKRTGESPTEIIISEHKGSKVIDMNNQH